MNDETDKRYVRVKKAPLIVACLVLAAGLVGWLLGRADTPPPTQTTSSQQTESSTPSSNTDGAEVKALVTYTLPDGWKETSCPNASGSIFIIPAGESGVDCDANPSAPVKMSVDASNSDDCNDLQNVQNVRKHICISLYINGKKSLKAETIYTQDSPYEKETHINAYYINTSKGIVKVEYIRGADDSEHLAGLDQLAMSVQTK